MILTNLALGYLAASCGTPLVQPELQGFVDDFFDDCQAYGNSLNTRLCVLGLQRFVEISLVESLPQPGIKGMCVTDASGKSTVSILNEDWGQLQLKATVYHELGHCVLGKGHDPMNQDSIMFPRVQSELHWEEHLSRNIPNFFATSRF